MSKPFLLIYDGIVPPRQELIQWLDRFRRVTDWHASPIPNLFVVVWDGSVVELRDLLRSRAGMVTFLAIEVDVEKFDQQLSGWLAQATIDFLMSASKRSAAAPDRIAS